MRPSVRATQLTTSAHQRLDVLGQSEEEQVRLHVAVADQQVLIYALTRLLDDIVWDDAGNPRSPTEDELERVRGILDMELAEMRDALLCKECGHVLADHDAKGCTYIACRNVCVRGND